MLPNDCTHKHKLNTFKNKVKKCKPDSWAVGCRERETLRTLTRSRLLKFQLHFYSCINICNFSLNDFVVGSWLELVSYLVMLILLHT